MTVPISHAYQVEDRFMRRLDLTSSGFLLAEKRETPMHVGGVNLFTLPAGADEYEFYQALLERLRTTTVLRKPFGERVVTGRSGYFWQRDPHMDMDYHVRHSALPAPGRYRELFVLVSRLHSILMDRTRPLWELHLIEGLQKRQFAIYNKVHHSAIDGMASMHITRAMCSESPQSGHGYAPYSLEAYENYKAYQLGDQPTPRPDRRELRNIVEALKAQFDSGTHIVTAMRRFGGAFFGRSGNLAVPWHNVPRTSINTRVSGSRRFVAQSFAFSRIRAIRKAMDATINDVVLTLCSGALRRYLLTHDELPRHSLKAMVPVSLRDSKDVDSTNAVGFITADLATNCYDPEKRLRAIQQSMQAGKELLRELSPREATIFLGLTQVPAVVTSLLGLSSRLPAFSTVISNVPGPDKPLYWYGARLDGMYPVSIVFDGFAMNITMISYAGNVDFGIVACRRSLPQIQRFIDHLEESLRELEMVAGIATAPSRATPAKRKATPRKKATPKLSAAAGGATGKGAVAARRKKPAGAGKRSRA